MLRDEVYCGCEVRAVDVCRGPEKLSRDVQIMSCRADPCELRDEGREMSARALRIVGRAVCSRCPPTRRITLGFP